MLVIRIGVRHKAEGARRVGPLIDDEPARAAAEVCRFQYPAGTVGRALVGTRARRTSELLALWISAAGIGRRAARGAV